MAGQHTSRTPEDPKGLLERDDELRVLDEVLRAARDGSGAMVVVEGPAGIGKTVLLDEARRIAASRGFRSQLARGGPLEIDLADGIARQLLEPPFHAASAAERAALLAGAAGLAAPVVSADGQTALPAEGESPDRRGPIVHGLYWLSANLAADAPLLLAVDDLQWSDAASLRFLLYLARRLDGLPIAVVATLRTGDTGAGREVIAELTADGSVRTVRPAALSRTAVEALARSRLGGEPDATFVDACRDATGGVPFLVDALLAELASEGVSPSAAGAAAVRRVTSATVGHAMVLRLARISDEASRVARCVAVLGRHADIPRVAELTELTPDAVLRACDALAGAGVVSGRRPVTFAHPIVMASVYDAMPAGERSLTHGAAARLLAREGADVEDVAVHLLATEPGTGTEVLGTLRSAAASALARGAPEAAITYLRRGLSEVRGPEVRSQILTELGRAESTLRDPLAIPHLREAMELSTDAGARAFVALDLAEALLAARRTDDALATVRRALDELGGAETEAAARLEVLRAALTSIEPALIDSFLADRARLEAIASRETPAGRRMAAILALTAADELQPRDRVAELARQALADATLVSGHDAETWGLQAIVALAQIGELGEARAAAEAMADGARRRGSVYGFVRSSSACAMVSARRGDLRMAEAELRSAFDLARQEVMAFALPSLLHGTVDVLLERRLDDVAEFVESPEHLAVQGDSYPTAMLLAVRGRLRIARGRVETGVDDLRRCGELVTALHGVSPAASGWRSALALALAESAPDEARRLGADDLRLARQGGLARETGIALRTVALVDSAGALISRLRESAAVLAAAGAPLEHARTLVELGAALRRGRERVAAQQPLRAALDLAHRCGADRLAERAENELATAGFRPRRRALTGLDALTPSEARVARHAAAGMSNREIAQALFVTAKTVENQLTIVYQKLEIRGREELTALLGDRPAH